MSGDTVRGFSMSAHYGMGIANVKPVAKMPIHPELVEKWEKEAAKRGISLDEHMARLFAEAEKEVGYGD